MEDTLRRYVVHDANPDVPGSGGIYHYEYRVKLPEFSRETYRTGHRDLILAKAQAAEVRTGGPGDGAGGLR